MTLLCLEFLWVTGFPGFRTDSDEHNDSGTLASLGLANLTTVLSFALLASSNIPALHAIGQVVAPGALLCLVLSAVLVTPSRPAIPQES